MRRIFILATLDTKSDEAQFLAELLAARGHVARVLDTSLAGTPNGAGRSLRETVVVRDGVNTGGMTMSRAEAMQIIASKAGKLLRHSFDTDELAGVIGIGGGTGTWIGNAAMAHLPLGVPKLIVSTMSSHDVASDIMVMPSIVDIAGLNGVLRTVLNAAANAVCGMVDGPSAPRDVSRPTVALSMFGLTTGGGTVVRGILENHGYEVLAFHANGAGGKTMERLISQSVFAGVVDWTTSELIDELVGGSCSAGPERMEAAGLAGLPQVVVPGGLDVINVGLTDLERFGNRCTHMHLPTVPLVRASTSESRDVALLMARKLNAARGPVSVLVPENGFSALDKEGEPFFDNPSDLAFIETLHRELSSSIKFSVIAAHINDVMFAEATAFEMIDLLVSCGHGSALGPDPKHSP